MGTLLAAADIAGFRVTPDGTLVGINDAFASLTGYERTELLETPFTAIVADDGHSFDFEAIASAHEADSRPVSTTTTIRTKAGTAVSCDVHLERFGPDDDPDIGGIIDRRPNAAATVAEPDLTYGKTFQALADALPDGIIVLDTDSDIQYANPAVERILGYTPDELVGSSKVTIIPPRLRQTHLDALKRYLETGERNLNWTYVELPGQHKAGHEIPLGVSINDFTYNGDRYFVGLFRDISPRKEAERTLTAKVTQLESVAYLGRHALENADTADLIEKSTELVAAALDTEYCTVLEHGGDGHDDPEFLLRDSVGPDGRSAGDDAVSPAGSGSLAAATLEAAGPVVVEDLDADGRFSEAVRTGSDVRSGITVTVGPASDPWGVLGVYDTTPRTFADHDVDFLESVATILSTAIERQTYERRLNETVAELEASNERLEQFAYAASHDLQEPLRMVSSYLRLIERRYGDELDADGREFIEFAVDGAERMRDMINGLLEYSRIDSQGDPFEPVDLNAILADVLTDLQVMIDGTDAEITTESLPTVEGDASQLRQLFQNLVSNAIEYCGDDPPRVHVSAERDGQTWRIAVRDNGIGIDPDDAERVFEVFQRLHSREEYDGTGIGLALCRRIVERHGGEIGVDSEPGGGSTFTVTLPVSGPSGGGTQSSTPRTHH